MFAARFARTWEVLSEQAIRRHNMMPLTLCTEVALVAMVDAIPPKKNPSQVCCPRITSLFRADEAYAEDYKTAAEGLHDQSACHRRKGSDLDAT